MLVPGFVVMSVAKAYGVVYNNREGLRDIVSRLETLFPKTMAKQLKHNVHKFNDDLKRISIFFIFMNTSGIWMYNLTPIFIQIYGIIFEGHFYDKKLPTPMWFWFDPYQPGTYEALYVLISWTGFTIAMTILATDLMFCSILTLVSMLFQILSSEIREIQSKDEAAVKLLKGQIKMHQELIEISQKIEEIFSPSFLLNVFSSSFVICLTLFQAVVRA